MGALEWKNRMSPVFSLLEALFMPPARFKFTNCSRVETGDGRPEAGPYRNDEPKWGIGICKFWGVDKEFSFYWNAYCYTLTSEC